MSCTLKFWREREWTEETTRERKRRLEQQTRDNKQTRSYISGQPHYRYSLKRLHYCWCIQFTAEQWLPERDPTTFSLSQPESIESSSGEGGQILEKANQRAK